ncbi:MAG: glucose-1-phosphate adenylyltransferase family protein [Candidatus Eiseniibacteriota bacterium]|jgi:glucose-1-phosphate adenylyltransferase
MPLRYAMILAGGVGSRLCVLSDKRAKPAVPFAGKYRIIDFTLSNCVNSGLTDIAILTQYKPASLNRHIGIGKPWDLDRRLGGVRLLQPYLGWEAKDWYRGTADAVHQNIEEVRRRQLTDVLILSGDHVYKMDYHAMYEFHVERRADATLGVIPVPWEETHKFGIVETDPSGRVSGFVEKPDQRPRTNTASMGVYLFRAGLLVDALERDAARPDSSHDFGKDVIPALLDRRLFAYRFDGYWQDIGTLDSYYEANLALTTDPSPVDLYEPDRAVHTEDTFHQPVKFVGNGAAAGSLLSNGCIIYGTVVNSVLSPGVVVERRAVVENSIVFNDAWIGPDSHLDRVILDKNVHVGRGCRLGVGPLDTTPNRRCPDHLRTGLSIVGKNTRLPEGLRIGRNVRIGSEVHESHFRDGVLTDGGSIEIPNEPSH